MRAIVTVKFEDTISIDDKALPISASREINMAAYEEAEIVPLFTQLVTSSILEHIKATEVALKVNRGKTLESYLAAKAKTEAEAEAAAKKAAEEKAKQDKIAESKKLADAAKAKPEDKK